MGVIFFLGIFILTRTIANNNGLAFTVALLASCADSIIYYQAEYHSQGLAYVFFPFLIYLMIKGKSVHAKRSVFTGLFAVFVLVFTVTHSYSLLILGLLGIVYLALMFVFNYSPYMKTRFSVSKENLRQDSVVWLIIIAVSAFYNIFVYPVVVQGLFSDVQSATAPQTVITYGAGWPWFTTVLNSLKWVLLLLAVPSLLYVVRSGKPNQLRMAILALCVLVAGFVGTFVVKLASDRILGFFVVLMAPFAAYTIYAAKDKSFDRRNRTVIVTVMLLVAVTVLVTGGIVNSQSPAYFFHGSGQNTRFFYANDLSSMNRYGVAGDWIKVVTPSNSRYITEEDTIFVPFYYAERPFSNEQPYLFYALQSGNINNQYILVNPTISYSFSGQYFDKHAFLQSTSIVYSDGTLVIAYNQSV